MLMERDSVIEWDSVKLRLSVDVREGESESVTVRDSVHDSE